MCVNSVFHQLKNIISSDLSTLFYYFNMTFYRTIYRSFQKISTIDKPMCVNSVFHQLKNIISSDLSTLFYYFNLALFHSLDIVIPSITLINRTYSTFSWFNTELIKLRQLLRRLQRKYASYKF